MPRLDRLDDVLFPVELRPVYAGVIDLAGERLLPVPDRKAIVDAKRERVVSVVSKEYRLVSNGEALAWAYKCCRQAFPETTNAEWQVSATDAPGTGGHCFIDLKHNSTALDFSVVVAKDRPDVFGPFIRVTNSYNGLRALSFDIGFMRKVCQNGMILADTIIRYKFAHRRQEIGDEIEFSIAHDHLAVLKTTFASYVDALRKCPVHPDEFGPFVRAVLAIRTPKALPKESPEAEQWDELTRHISKLSDRYTTELGANAYAVLNAVTELASKPPTNRHLQRERHSLQKLAGAWLGEFAKQCREPDFNLSRYLIQRL